MYLQLVERNREIKEKLNKHIDSFLYNLSTENGIIQEDYTKIPEFHSHMDKFFKEYGIPYMAWIVYAIDELLKKAVSNFEQDGATLDDVSFIRELYGVKGDEVATRRNGQPTALYALASMSVLRVDITNKMQSSFMGDVSLNDFRKAIEKSVDRKYYDFFEVNSVAMLFNTYNGANYHFAKKYDYNKFTYNGGLIAESREFCQQRDGKEFWVYQGKEWNDLDWRGKIPGVDFFVQCGGYNCRHWVEYYKE